MSSSRDLFSLAGRIAVITGGSGKLGQQFAQVMVAYGAKVILLDLLQPPMRQNHVHYFKVDITKRKQIEDAAAMICKKWTVPKILVNNAVLDSPPNAPASENGPFESYPEDSFDRIMNVNVKGTFLCCQVFGGLMAEARAGSIINICSTYGLLSPVQEIYEYKRRTGSQWYKPAPYSVSKSAILNLTRYLGTYWAKKNVRVNTLTPGGVFNNQDKEFLAEYCRRIPVGRMADSNELNGAIVFLASDASSYMTGANLVVDGGWSAW
jgi:NAD(P)-dependent dehydrogenase (short-subunit alcohol dehydrogenase family)